MVPKSTAVVVLAVALAADAAARQCGEPWTVVAPQSNNPPGRQDFAAAYDPSRDRIVIFGGRTLPPTSTVLAETWEFDFPTGQWIDRGRMGPPPGADGRMTFNPADNSCVYLGGASGWFNYSGTWRWDGATWLMVNGGPSRIKVPVVHYPPLGTLVGIGGHSNTAGAHTPSATSAFMTWSGSGWTYLTGPDESHDAFLVYEPMSDALFFTGGYYVVSGGGGSYFNQPRRRTYIRTAGQWSLVDSGAYLPANPTPLGAYADPASGAVFREDIDGTFRRWSGSLWEIVPGTTNPSRPGGPRVTVGSFVYAIDGSSGTLTVWRRELPVAPTILNPSPSPGTIVRREPGSDLSLAFVAAGVSPLSIQWRRDGVPLTDGGNVSGSSTPNLLVSPVTCDDLAAYDAVVSNPSCSPSATSALWTVRRPGDTNGDRSVTFADLNTVLTQFGQTGPGLPGDVNGDGVVNFSDLNDVLSSYGAAC